MRLPISCISAMLTSSARFFWDAFSWFFFSKIMNVPSCKILIALLSLNPRHADDVYHAVLESAKEVRSSNA